MMQTSDMQIRFDADRWNPRLVLGTYNFHWYYNGDKAVLFPSENNYYIVEASKDKLNIKCSKECCSKEEIEELLGLNEDLKEFYYLTKNDPLLSCSEKALKGYHIRISPLWESVVISIMQQNNSFKQGWRTLFKLIEYLGKEMRIGSMETRLFPSPRDVIEKRFLLEKTRMGYRKNILIETASTAINDGLSYSLPRLLKIKGIGRYTACNALLLSKRDYSCPPIDRWVLSLVSEAYEPVETIDDAVKILKARFPGYEGLAINFLTILTDAEPRSIVLRKLREKTLLCPDPNKVFTPLNMWRITGL